MTQPTTPVASWPVCMFCQTRFTLEIGTTPTRCESWRSIDHTHVERRVATPEQLARMRPDAPPELRENAHDMRTKTKSESAASLFGRSAEEAKKDPAPTPFDAAALRAGKPTGQPSLF